VEPIGRVARPASSMLPEILAELSTRFCKITITYACTRAPAAKGGQRLVPVPLWLAPKLVMLVRSLVAAL